MFFERLFYAIGVMAFAYVLSELSLLALEKVEQSGKFKFLSMVLAVVHWFSSMASLFFGLFMYYQKEHAGGLQQRVGELAMLQRDALERCEALENENKQLQHQLGLEVARTEKRSYDDGFRSGYFNGYTVGFEDCMDVLELSEEHKSSYTWMARHSGIHRYKTRPSVLVNTKAVNKDGILM